MDSDRFITIVERATGVSREAAERATRATLQTLADRISKVEALLRLRDANREVSGDIGGLPPAWAPSNSAWFE
jgi:hypothetical protein